MAICPALYIDEAQYGTLSEFEQSGVKLDEAARRHLCLDVSLGVQALHNAGIVHGDIKAENTLVFENDEGGYTAKLSDFGCAIFLETYKGKEPPPMVRLPGISRPWCAPEARDPVSSDELVYTDVYSLGLLLFRLMVFMEPFKVFDLATEKEERLSSIEQLLQLKNLPNMISWAVEEALAAKWSDNVRLATNAIFNSALGFNPRARDIGLIVDLLTYLLKDDLEADDVTSRIMAGSHDTETQAVPLSAYARGPADTLQPFTIPYMMISALPLALRKRTEEFLAVIFDDLCAGTERDPVLLSPLRQSITWSLFNFYLHGYGGYYSKPQAALDLLYKAGLSENGRFWKSWILYLPLQRALGTAITQEQLDIASQWTIVVCATHDGFAKDILPLLDINDMDGYNRTRAIDAGALESSVRRFEDSFGSKDTGSYAATIDTKFADCMLEHDNTLLHMAAIFNYTGLVDYLIRDNRVNFNAMNGRSETALLLACKYGRIEILHRLLDAKADASITTNGRMGENALYWLSSFSNEDIPIVAAKLHEAGASLQHIFHENDAVRSQYDQDQFIYSGVVDRSPLLRAISKGCIPAVKVLMDMTLNMFKDEDLAIALRHCFPVAIQLAAQLHSPKVLDLLCSYLSAAMRTTLKYSENEWEPEFTGIWTRIVKSQAFVAALRTDAYIERLCLLGPNWKMACGQTLAVLSKFGLLPEVFNFAGQQTNIVEACVVHFRNNAALEYLVSQEKFKKFINPTPEFPLFAAIDGSLDRDNLEAFHILANAGAELNLNKNPVPGHRLSYSGSNFLHVCANKRLDELDVLNRIIDAGVPIETATNEGITPLMMAVMKGNFGMAKLLLERGASVNTFAANDYTVLGYILEPVISTQCDDLVCSVK
ncbi:hypothetical protein N0V90_011863 [Kalmusia sp. IMI 367209]|nr:hypothetical protein N0V90_011863 [Kalmusia sp. IMI 367209]